MKDYISREAAREELLRQNLTWEDWHKADYAMVCVPAAPVREVKWISVNDKLPKDDDKRYLVSYELMSCGTWIAIAWYSQNLESVDEYDFEGEKRGGWYDYDNEYGHFEVSGVHHWMPLPEPPKEGGTEMSCSTCKQKDTCVDAYTAASEFCNGEEEDEWMGYIRVCDLCGKPLQEVGREYRIKRRWYSWHENGWEPIEAHDECVRKLLNAKADPAEEGE